MVAKEVRQARLRRYAAEFVVIFLGVWLSLLAEQWRQGREDRESERLALEGLLQDLEVDVADMSGNLKRADRSVEAASQILALRSGIERPASDLAPMLTELGPCSFPQWNTSQYAALKASGDLNLIKNRVLRASIARYYEGLSGLQWLHEVDCAESRGLFDELSRVVELGIQGAEPEPGRTREFSAVVARVEDPAGLVNDLVLMDRVAKLTAHRSFLRTWIQQELNRAEALRAEIAEELDR